MSAPHGQRDALRHGEVEEPSSSLPAAPRRSLQPVYEEASTSPTVAHAPPPPGPLARAFRARRRSSAVIPVHEEKDGENSNDQKTANAIDVAKASEKSKDQKTANAGNAGAAAKGKGQAELGGGFASLGCELDDSAPLWRVYRDDVRNHDQNVTLDEWNKTLDVLLIFAGLFSAVVTTFVVASFPLLDPQEDYVATALYSLARSLDANTTLSAPTPVGPAKASSLWINGLWFASLFVSLSVAFFAILAKQWLVEYNHRMADPLADPSWDEYNQIHRMAGPHVTPNASLHWARRRGFFFDGFDKWHVPALVTQILPLLLHVALFLFLVGLSVFIWTLNRPIARGMIAFTALLFALYIISTILPVWRLDCPTATPLIRQAREVFLWLAYKAVDLYADLTCSSPSSRAWNFRVHLWRRLVRIRIASWDNERQSPHDLAVDRDRRDKRDKAVRERTLKWLILVSGSESAIFQVFQSIGAWDPEDWFFIDFLRRMTVGMSAFNSLPVAPTALEVVRAARSELLLGLERNLYDAPMLPLDLTAPMIEALKATYSPDAKLLWASMNLDARSPASPSTSDGRQVAEHISSLRTVAISYLRSRTSTSLHSTAVLLLRSAGCPQSAVPYLVAIVAVKEAILGDGHNNEAILRVHHRTPDNRPPRHASPQLYHLLDAVGYLAPICKCARTAGIVCTALTFDNNGDCQIGGWIISVCSQFCDCENAAPEWRTVRQLFDDSRQAHSLFYSYVGADRWEYRGALLLTLLSFGDGDAAVHVLDYTGDHELNEILKCVLRLDFSELPSIRSEIWQMVLIRAMTSRRAPLSVTNLQWILAAACMLQRRAPLDQEVKDILKPKVDTLLESPKASGFADSPDYSHFSQHLVEFDPGYVSRLNAIREDSGSAATHGEPAKCVTCGFQPDSELVPPN